MKEKFNLVYTYYIYLICFASIVFIIFSLSFFVHSSVQALWPQFMLPENIKRNHYDNKNFVNRTKELYYYDEESEAVSNLKAYYAGKTSVEVSALREDSLRYEVKLFREEAVKTMINSGIYFLLALFLFAVHWRLARNLRSRLD